VRVLAVDPERPGVVYAEASGVFRSADGGESWSRLPLDASPVAALAVLPGSGALLAASGQKLYKSLDDGSHWTLLSTMPPGRSGFGSSVKELLVGGSGTEAIWVISESSELFRSTDEGSTWERVPIVTGGRTVSILSLAFDPSTPSTLYAGSWSGEVVKSLDRGAHWELVSTGLPASPSAVEVWSVAVDPTTPSTVYAGLDGGAVYLSLDGGAHWTATGEITGTPRRIERLSVDAVTSTVFATDWYGRTYRSLDRGTTWSALRVVSPTGCRPLGVSGLVLAGDGRTVYAGTTRSGAFRSDDEGSSWRSLGTLAPMSAFTLALDPSSPGGLFLVAGSDLHRSRDGGATWRVVGSGDAGSACAFFDVVAADPRGSGTVYGILGGYPGEPLFRSADGGSTWEPAGPSRFIGPQALAVNPVDPKDLYLSIAGDHTASVRPALGDTVNPFDTALYRSRDGGVTVSAEWTPRIGPRTAPIQFVLFDPRDPDTVWAGGDALYRKRGSGEWTKLPLPTREFREGYGFGVVTGIAIDVRAGAVYTAVRGAGVYRSLDDGTSWVDVSGNLPTDHLPWEETRLRPAATGLAFEPLTGKLFLSALAIDLSWGDQGVVRVPGGVYETSDGGTTWELVSEGLLAAGVDQMLLDTRGAPTLFAVTAWGRSGSGLFARDLSAPLRLDAISPTSGSTEGGTLVLLSGDGFRPDSVVTVGGSATREFTFFSPQRIRVRTGAHPSGLEDVTVTNPDGARATLSAAFSYASWSCETSATTLCLENGRFQVTVFGPDGAAAAAPLTLKSGYFWFDWNQNPRVVVKILDGRIDNGHYWIHVSGLTDAGFTVRVTDRVSRDTRDYVNPAGQALSMIDRESF
jgi:photosystem II stability/assembly factor-like uncharacterized protein